MKDIWHRFHCVAMVLLVILAVLTASCGRAQDESAARVGAVPEIDEMPVLLTLPSFVLTDQSGARFGTDELRGKVWVANFIFTRCQATCPLQTAQMARLQGQLQKHPRWSEVHLVSISVDPEHDRPAVLRDYAEDKGADARHWRFLTGERDYIWRLSKDGFKLPVGDNPGNGNMPLFHASHLVVVDGQSRVRGYFDGLTDEGLERSARGVDKILEELTLLVQDEKTSK
jgi:cytochrome oxidase Cu insertion factor (SCO1/SenC/PrrC family)